MAMANIFAKVQDLENKILDFNGSFGNAVDNTDILDRLSKLENQSQMYNNRMTALEDLFNKVNIIEATLPELKKIITEFESNFLGKLSHIESVLLTDLYARVAVLENKTHTEPVA